MNEHITKKIVVITLLLLSNVFAQSKWESGDDWDSESEAPLSEKEALEIERLKIALENEKLMLEKNKKSMNTNYTTGERWGTWALNSFTINGLGSWIIMHDGLGGAIHFGFGLVSTFLLVDAVSDPKEECSTDYYGSYCELQVDLTSFFLVSIAGSIWNIYRSVSYDKPKEDYAFTDPRNFRLFAMPKQRGNGFIPGVSYNVKF